MSGKNIIFYLLTAFITGTLVLVYIQYNSTKNINALTKGNQQYVEEYNINAGLRELEKDIVRIESNISDFVSTNNNDFIQGIDAKISKVQIDLDRLQEIRDDEITSKLVDDLDTAVHAKLVFCKLILDTLRHKGKIQAENLINSLEGKRLMDSIYDYADQVQDARHRLIKNLNDQNIKSGNRAERLNDILIFLTLFSAAILFLYIISIIQKLIQSEKKVKTAARIKENFLANMSHEIRTPMNAILGFTALLDRQQLDEKSKSYVRTIQNSGENLLTIINDILDLSKIEAGMMRIESAPFSIRGLLQSVQVMFSAKAGERNLLLQTQVDESMPDILEGDATRLTQILVNLTGNAIKFTEAGSISVHVTNKGQEGKIIKTGIEVTDTGLGIEKSKQQEIFNRFQQADDTVTRHFGGTGLGLSIVKELVTLQNGTLELESEPGKGTSFLLTIPYIISESHVEERNDHHENTVTPHDHFVHKKVLVAEDNEINQNLIKYLFSEWKLEYDLVQNGKEAVDILSGNKYDLILMDIQMPEMDGYSATIYIRETLKLKTPIIAMTAHALAGEREKCLSYGMDEYISKPIREDQLYMLIAQFTNISPNPVSRAKQVTHLNPNHYSHINLEYMREISGGNTEYEKEVTGLFIESVPEALATIENAWRYKDINELRQQAHNMKTTISVMGLTDKLQPILEKLEYSELSPDSFSTQFALLQTVCNDALSEAKEFYKTI